MKRLGYMRGNEMAQKKNGKIEQIVSARGRSDGLFMVQSTYFESDAINATGMVLRNDWARDGSFDTVLNTNDSLNPLWCSPEENLWIGSGRGNVYTTAQVRFPPHRMPNLDYDANLGFVWNVTTLPDMQGHGYRPNITCIWGTNDNQVFAGTFKGGIYQWDGNSWTQTYSDVESAINDIHGSDAGNVFAVGRDGLILHFDGTQWRQIPYVTDDPSGRNLTAVRAIDNKETLIAGTDGRILNGNRNGMQILGEYEVGLYGVAPFNGHVYLAAGDSGVYELLGPKIKLLKDNFSAVGVFETPSKLFFTEPNPDLASIIEYDPSEAKPWWRRTY